MIDYILQFFLTSPVFVCSPVCKSLQNITALRVQHISSPPDSSKTSRGLLAVIYISFVLYDGSAKSISFCFAQPINCNAFSSLFFRYVTYMLFMNSSSSTGMSLRFIGI